MITSFDGFRVDAGARQLLRDGRSVHLSAKAFELLLTLLDARPRVVSERDLQDRLWPGTFVAEANLSNLVAELRAALGDHARAPRFVRTAHGYGYAFSCEASSQPERPPRSDLSPVCWLLWGQAHFMCGIGEHIIGRDTCADVRLDAPTVSRRHARLIVSADHVDLEDLGSKNGTFRSQERITASIRLGDGDVVGIGSVTLTFRVRQVAATTRTRL